MDEQILHDEEIRNCFDRIKQRSSTDEILHNQVSTFRKYPNGYYISDSTNASEFLTQTIREKTNRDKLSILLSQVELIKKLGTKALSFSLPDNLLHQDEKIIAIKFINESILIWTDLHVFKLPASLKAIERIENTKIKTDLLMTLDKRVRAKYLTPSFISQNDILIQYSKRCDLLELTQKNIHRLDDFLHDYFILIFFFSNKQSNLYVGLQHGDLHYRNIFIDEHDELHITDIDMLDDNGYPFLDIFHFAVHLVRTKENLKQYSPLEMHLKDSSYLYHKLNQYGFDGLADLWLKYYDPKYDDLYIQSQIEWYRTNQVVNDELEQILKLRDQ